MHVGALSLWEFLGLEQSIFGVLKCTTFFTASALALNMLLSVFPTLLGKLYLWQHGDKNRIEAACAWISEVQNGITIQQRVSADKIY